MDTDNHTRTGDAARYTVKTKGTAYLAASPALNRVTPFTAGDQKPGCVLYMAPWKLSGLASLYRYFRQHGVSTDLGATEAEAEADLRRWQGPLYNTYSRKVRGPFEIIYSRKVAAKSEP